MAQYTVTVNGKIIGFVESTSSLVYDPKLEDGREWVTLEDGTIRGDRTIGKVRRTDPLSNLGHMFHSQHPEYVHLDGERATVSVSPI